MDFNNFISPVTGDELVKKNDSLESLGKEKYKIIGNIPRFVPKENFASAFGLQWNTYSKVQLDSQNNTTISEERVKTAIGKPLSSIKGLKILEAGSGAGRFTEILLKYGAIVYSFDISAAVDANFMNNSGNQNLTIFQADIEQIPFQDNFFDASLCLGVLQHTKDSILSLKELKRVTKKNGMISFDHYEKRLGQYISLYLVYWVLIKKFSTSKQLKITKSLTKKFFPIHWVFRNFPLVQFLLRRISPISFYYGMFNLTKSQHYEISLLDTHDKNTDHYKRMLTLKQLKQMVETLNFQSYEVFHGGTGLQCIIIK
ncbi:class I SAM-dependent methyltransferase [Gammaproteobacteria bacterium]|nr:class I SAM-dependent methyltransferase [Gammaproteobacteria bacterium]